MALNCRPKQMAWISFPPARCWRAFGLDGLNGHIVETQHLLAGAGRVWVVKPPQTCVVTAPIGGTQPGARMEVLGVPDKFLRPLSDFSPEQLQELEREAVS